MKKFILAAVAAALLTVAPAHAQFNICNHVAASASVGTTGVSVELATPVTNFLALKAGVSIMPDIKFSTTTDIEANIMGTRRSYSTDIDLGMGRTQGNVVLNFYPLQRKLPLYVAAGLYFGGDKLLSIKGRSQQFINDIESGKIPASEISQYQLPIEQYLVSLNDKHEVDASFNVKKVRPYVGIGWGQAIPGKLLNFNVELGVQFHGNPVPYNNGAEAAINPNYDPSKASSTDKTLRDVIDKFTVYPVLKFTISGRLF